MVYDPQKDDPDYMQFKFEVDQNHVLCLRSVLMKPEHELWVDEIVTRLNRTD